MPVFSVYDRLQCFLNQLWYYMVFFFCIWKLSVWSFVLFLLVLSILSNTYLPMGFEYFLLWRLCPLYNEKHCCVKEAIILTVKIWWSGHKIIYSGNPIKFIRNLQNRKFHGISNKFDKFCSYALFWPKMRCGNFVCPERGLLFTSQTSNFQYLPSALSEVNDKSDDTHYKKRFIDFALVQCALAPYHHFCLL